MATISDIAKMAGVSAATVSHVVNGTRYVSPELREKVENAIKNADIPPNFVIRKRNKKQAENANCPDFILLLVSDAQNLYTLELERILEEKMTAKGYLLFTVDISGKGKTELIKQILTENEHLLGVILSVDISTSKEAELINEFHVPKVVVGNEILGVECNRVMSANFDGAYKATVHLIRSGHERIALFCRNGMSESNQDRIAGYKKALRDNGIEICKEYLVTDLADSRATYDALYELRKQNREPSAIFVANKKTLISVFRYMDKNNIKCPKDISVVGFNDFNWAPLMNPPITVIKQDMEELCQRAIELLSEDIERNGNGEWKEKKASYKKIEIPTELCVRGSTCGIGRGPFGEKAADIAELNLTEEEIERCKKSNFTAAVSFHYSGKSWMLLHEEGIRSVFNKLNISLIAITDANFDPELQNKQLKSIMMLEPDALIAIPTDNKKTADTFQRIVKTDTKMIFISNVPDGITRSDYSTCVSVNERSHGRNIGRGLGEYMRKTQKSKVAILKYRDGFYATNQRDIAGEQILAEEYPELEICAVENFVTEEEAYDVTMKLMRRMSEIEGIYVSWEGPAQHVMRALIDLERQDVAISTGDLEYNIALNMAKGGMVKAVSAQCPFEQGKALALSVANVLLGKKIPTYIGVEPVYVEKENLRKAWQKVYRQDAPKQLVELLV